MADVGNANVPVHTRPHPASPPSSNTDPVIQSSGSPSSSTSPHAATSPPSDNSASTARTSPPASPTPTHDAHSDTEDIWASSPSLSEPHHQRSASRREEGSDLPALRRQHITTGYRAGLSAGTDNPATAQSGFDEGFPVGAELGLRVGWCLGVLRALKHRSRVDGDGEGQGEGEGKGVGEMLEQAERELTLENLVEVPEFDGEEGEGEEGEKREVVRWDVVEGWVEKVREMARERGWDVKRA